MPILHAKVLGSGTPLLILHGFLGMLDNWKTLGSAYAEAGFEVHLIDQRNHGKSFHSEDFNYDVLAVDVLEYLEANQIKSTAIIGHSMGGKTAMNFACKYPERIKKLIVADIAPKYYPPHHHSIISGLKSLDFKTITSRKEADSKLAETISEPGVRQFLLKNLYWETKERLALRFNLTVLSTKMEEVGENIENSAQFNGATLFLKGDRSEYVTEADEQLIQFHFPKATTQTIPKAGHWLHAENPKAFLTQSLDFLNT